MNSKGLSNGTQQNGNGHLNGYNQESAYTRVSSGTLSSSWRSSELHTAVEQKDIKKVKKLLSKPKKMRLQLLSYDHEGQTPLTSALKNNDEGMVELLLQAYKEAKVDINTKDKNGYTALHQAVQSDDQILISILKWEGIDVDVENADKNRPLHYFCQKFKSPNCSEPFQLFIEKGCNVNAQNNNGETPLHKAIFNNYVRLLMVDLLLKNGANVNLNNSMGESALHYAVRLGRDDLVSVLLRAGADVTKMGEGKEKKTPYQLAYMRATRKWPLVSANIKNCWIGFMTFSWTCTRHSL